MAQECTADDTQTLSTHELQSNLNLLKSQPRYRTSISTESPMVILTPPKSSEVIREQRRLSASVSVSASHNSEHDDDDEHTDVHGHLIPPTEPTESTDAQSVQDLIDQRRPSAINGLGDTIKQLFIDKKVREDGVPALIVDGVYLGSIGAAKNFEWLSSHGVTHVLCVAGGIGECFADSFSYLVVVIDDAPSEDISEHFADCFSFMDSAVSSGGKVLVHCFAGVSRSVTVVSAYLMHKERIGAVAALKRVKARRSVANPNAGFIVQLIRFQQQSTLSKAELADADGDIDADGDADGDEKQQACAVTTSSLVRRWESGRRPSMFTALAKLTALKNRSRADSANDDDADDDDDDTQTLNSKPAAKKNVSLAIADVEEVVTPLEHYDVDGDDDGDGTFPAAHNEKDV